MKLSLRIRYADPATLAELVCAAERLGFDGVWVSEPWGVDAASVLGWCAARTCKLVLGTHVASVHARTPAATVTVPLGEGQRPLRSALAGTAELAGVPQDLPALLRLERAWSALYLGGMGSFYARAASASGHGAMVDAVRERFAAGDRQGARDAVSDTYADGVGLFGPPERVRERAERYAGAGVDELVLELRKPGRADHLEDMAAARKAIG